MPAIRFRVLGVPVEIRTSFLLLAVVLGLQRHTDSLLAVWIVIATAAVLAHEAGHAAAFRAFGIAPSVVLHGGGGQTAGTDPGIHRRIVLVLAGPTAGVLLGVMAVLASRTLPATATTQALIDDVLFATLGWSLLNLLPIGGMDGHSIMQDVVRLVLGHPAVAAIRLVGICTVLALVAGAIALGQFEAAFVIAFVAILTSTPLDRAPVLGTRSNVAMSPGLMLMQGRTAEALEAADGAIARHPEDVDARLHRATALRLLTRYAEAEAAYTDLLARWPDVEAARAGRAMVRAVMGRDDDARVDIEVLAAAPVVDGSTDANRVIALYVSHRYTEAADVIAASLARADAASAERSRLTGLQALIDGALGRPESALAHVERTLRDRPDDFTLHELRALTLIDLGRADEAMKSARRALDAAPRNPELLETMGLAERFAGRPDQALGHLLAAATDRPELPRARAELSACFTQLGRLDEARDALASLAETARDDPFVAYAEACLLGATGDHAKAVERLAAAVRIRPGLGRRASADPVLGWVRGEPAAPIPMGASNQANAPM